MRALVEIAEADASRLSRRTYGIARLSPEAGDLADKIRGAVTGARIEFAPTTRPCR